MFDKKCMEICKKNVNMTVPWYLMAAHAYYVEDDPIVSDETYDKLARMILKGWPKITHRHKDVLTLDGLKAGTFLGEYPSMVPGAVEELRKRG